MKNPFLLSLIYDRIASCVFMHYIDSSNFAHTLFI